MSRTLHRWFLLALTPLIVPACPEKDDGTETADTGEGDTAPVAVAEYGAPVGCWVARGAGPGDDEGEDFRF